LILVGNRLHVLNLSQQSDAVDLLGGYKPFDSLLLLKQTYRDFSIEQSTNDYIEEVQVNICINIILKSIFFIF
jgi:midasin (ATPase involved in ribosome maturation)